MFYIILILFVLIGEICSKKFKKSGKKVLTSFYTVVLVMFFGLRGFIWSDWYHYYPSFIVIEPFYDIFTVKSNFNMLDYEIGYKIYMSIIKIFTGNYHIYTLISVIIDFIFLNKIFKFYKINFLFGILLFIGFEGLVLEFDLSRNIKGLLIYIYSIQYFYDKNKWKFIFLSIIAVSFHATIIINILLTPILLYYFPFFIRVTLFLFFIFYRVFNVRLINNFLFFIKDTLPERFLIKIEAYLNNPYYSQVEKIGLTFIEKTLFFIVIIVLYKKIYNKDLKNRIILNSSFVYFFTYYILAEILVLKQRFGTNFIYIYWILIPLILKEVSKNKKIIIKFFIILYILLKFFKDFVFVVDDEIEKSLKYENIIFEHKNFSQRYQEFLEYSEYREKSME
ncbi:MAG: EpsG family protein [Cetobacterium sp.]